MALFASWRLIRRVFLLVAFASAAGAEGGDLRYLAPSSTGGSSGAVVVGDVPLAHTSLMLPVDSQGNLVGRNDPTSQIEQVFRNLSAALKAAGSSLNRTVRLHVYVARDEVVLDVRQTLPARFTGSPGPAVTFVQGNLAHPEALVAMDAVAVAPTAPAEVLHSDSPRLPRRRGSSHVAVLPAGRSAVYVAGRASPGGFREAMHGTLEQLRGDLESLGRSHADTVQLKVFMQPMSSVGEAEEVIAEYFGEEKNPSVVYVEWLHSSLPVEIEAVAAGAPLEQASSEPVEYFSPTPRFSRITRVNRAEKIFISGLYGRTSNDAAAQIHEIFADLKELLEKAESDLRHLVKATYYVSDPEADRQINEIRPEYYDPRRTPSASKLAVTSTGRPGKGITFDMVAVRRP